jgi:hypothetical protein
VGAGDDRGGGDCDGGDGELSERTMAGWAAAAHTT